MINRAFVIAHYDAQGAVRSDFVTLVTKLAELSEHTVVVSTNLADSAKKRLEELCSVITRPNEGYDFYSYKIGLESLGSLDAFDEIVFLNYSFFCFEPDKFIQQFLAFPRVKKQLIGISSSSEYTQHLQSYFIAFPRDVVAEPFFKEWWEAVAIHNEREVVIQKYELGLSTYFLDHGCTLSTLFTPTPSQRKTADQLFRDIYHREPDAMASNPTHFNWEDMLEELGILKVELITKNPHGINLAHFHKKYGARYKQSLDEVRKGLGLKERLRVIKRVLVRRVKG